jgi:imidazolonepropionase-like amidohydrolase
MVALFIKGMVHPNMLNKKVFFFTVSFIFILTIFSGILAAQQSLMLKVGRLFQGDGRVLTDAVIVVKEGKIHFVGKYYPESKDLQVFEWKEGVAVPGFIAANAYMNVCHQVKVAQATLRRGYSYKILEVKGINEERSESTPEINLLGVIDPRSSDFEKAWRGGVTCVYIAPGNFNVFNGTGTVLKTFGQTPKSMLVKNNVHLKVTLGSGPASGGGRFGDFGLKTRRPQNRMGVDFIFRYELFKAKQKKDLSEDELSFQERIFRQVLEQKIPLRIRARSYMDIKAAFRIMGEFGFQWILEDGVDAYKYFNELKKHNIPVIYGPVYKPVGRNDFNIEQDTYYEQTPVLMEEKGIRFAFQNNLVTPIDALRDEAIYAVRIGLSKEAALKALTHDAAIILGVEERLGTIKKGKDADILIFSGDPFDPASSLKRVMINGKLLDPDE